MNFQAVFERGKAIYAASGAMLIAVSSIVHGLPLFMSARPKTPLRVLCIMAFDMLHRLRHAKSLPQARRRLLAALLDVGACANAAFDRKACCRHECRMTLQLLEEGGIGSSVAEYLQRLGDLESGRPRPGGEECQFQKVRLYREAVVRLSLGIVAATAGVSPCLDAGIRATWGATDLNLLFRIAMQCQIIDDVLDYSRDLAAGLPSFLTACRSPSQATELTRLAALAYADDCNLPRTAVLLPLRSALFLVTTCTKLVSFLGRQIVSPAPASTGPPLTVRRCRSAAEAGVALRCGSRNPC